jgi:flagellar motor switch protein FliG
MSVATSTKPDGARRVAALLLSLDQDSAAALLKTLAPGVLPRVADAMTALETEGANATERTGVWRDLVRELENPPVQHPRVRDEEELSRFLESSLGKERATSVLAQMRESRRIERPFIAIEEARPEHVAKALAAESTAVRALVVGHLPPKLAAAVLAMFDAEESFQIVRRLAKRGTTRRETVDMIAKSIATEVAKYASEPPKPEPSERMRSIAAILNRADKDLGRNVLTGLEENDKPIAEGIREAMFTWNDLAKLDRRAMQKVLSTVETGKLALALKGGPADVEQNVLANLSQRVRDMVAEERELLGPRPRSEVDAARAELMRGIRSLVESGELSAQVSAEGMVE